MTEPPTAGPAEYDFSGLPLRAERIGDRAVGGAGRIVALLALPLAGLFLIVVGALMTASVPAGATACTDPALCEAGEVSSIDVFLSSLGDGVRVAGGATVAVGLGLAAWLIVRPRTAA